MSLRLECSRKITGLAAALMIGACAQGCSHTEGGARVAVAPDEDTVEEYHADNDIAMTVLSLADALRVGEPLDSAEYDYEGVLTDGQGSPLYTDVQGSPGVWVVDVLDAGNVMIRNLYLGDLLPADLQTYLLLNLGAEPESQLAFTAHEAVDDDETDIEVYDLGDVFVRFEVRYGIAPNGLEGPLMSIILTSSRPVGAETQTTV